MTDVEAADPNKRVFRIMRVSSAVPSSHKKTIKTQALYNGIYPNTWFSPFGITQKKDVRHDRWFMSIPDACMKTVEDRAKSASSILGRRHFEVDRQTLAKEEILQGINVLSKEGADNVLDTDKYKERKVRVRFVDNKYQYMTSDIKLSYSAERRPTTAPSILKASCQVRCAVLPDLTVTKLMVSNNKTHDNMVNTNELSDDKKQRCVSAIDVRARSAILNDVGTLKSVTAMREAYQIKMNKDLDSIDQNIEIDCRKDLTKIKIALELQGKDNHRSLYHHRSEKRLITPRNRFEHDEKKHIRRSGLKPLLYSEEHELLHSAECPYNCPGCFRACLASDDYFEKAEEQMKERLRKQKKSRMHPRSVLYGLEPRAHLRVFKREIPKIETEFAHNREELEEEFVNIESIE